MLSSVSKTSNSNLGELSVNAKGSSAASPALRRSLGVVLLTLYGVGVTVGAGIYVLIGAVAGHAGTGDVQALPSLTAPPEG